MKLKNETNFPWIMSNVFHCQTKKPLGEGLEYLIIEKNKIKVEMIKINYRNHLLIN